MRLVTVATTDQPEVAGLLRPDGSVVPLASLGFSSVLALVEAGPTAWDGLAQRAASASTVLSAEGLRFLAPIPRPPRNMICVGVNYRSHFDEGKRPEGSTVPDAPVLFTKPFTSLIGHDGVVELDREATQRVDWEAELAIVIGRPGRNVAPEDGLSHVFGFTLANDVSARDLQLAHGHFGQWFKGKGLDGFCPLGPSIVTVDEIADYRNLRVQLTVNGVLKQNFVAADMVNDVGRIVSRVSLGMSLVPGDVILTGTAAGVGHWREPPEFLHGGDVVEVSCDELGVLRSHFVER
jgi:2,4-didehydro-3-deoxy-L-rhamnonate hydrolase